MYKSFERHNYHLFSVHIYNHKFPKYSKQARTINRSSFTLWVTFINLSYSCPGFLPSKKALIINVLKNQQYHLCLIHKLKNFSSKHDLNSHIVGSSKFHSGCLSRSDTLYCFSDYPSILQLLKCNYSILWDLVINIMAPRCCSKWQFLTQVI